MKHPDNDLSRQLCSFGQQGFSIGPTRMPARALLCCIALVLLGTAESSPPLMVVDLTNHSLATRIAVQVCTGLFNRAPEQHGAAYTLGLQGNDADWLRDVAGIVDPKAAAISSDAFLDLCLSPSANVAKGYIRYNSSSQKLVTPNLITVAAVLDAVPLETGDATRNSTMLFDALTAFDGFSALQATEYVYDRYGNLTTTMAKMNPGLDVHGKHKLNPPLTGNPNPGLIDFIVQKRIFNFFLNDGCIPGTQEHALMERIATTNVWPRPITVFGYDDTFALAGDLFEAETTCVKEHNMGQVASDGLSNLAYFSRNGPIDDPIRQLPTPTAMTAPYNSSLTYVAVVMGDGDNMNFIKGSRRDWMNQRVANCAGTGSKSGCPPLLWSMSPRVLDLAPDLLHWYLNASYTTGADWFVLPPSGDLYAYPSLMSDDDQQSFVTRTEHDARMMGTDSTVAWEFMGTWGNAIRNYFPRYGGSGNGSTAVVRGFFAVNVPYMTPVAEFGLREHYKLLGANRDVVLFKPREWRGDRGGGKQNINASQMAAEISGYPKGTVSNIYVTSDGGANLDLVYDMMSGVQEHVRFVNAETITRLALERGI